MCVKKEQKSTIEVLLLDSRTFFRRTVEFLAHEKAEEKTMNSGEIFVSKTSIIFYDSVLLLLLLLF